VQARFAFATYLTCIQQRLTNETRSEIDTDTDAANEQMVCRVCVAFLPKWTDGAMSQTVLCGLACFQCCSPVRPSVWNSAADYSTWFGPWTRQFSASVKHVVCTLSGTTYQRCSNERFCTFLTLFFAL